MRAILQPRRRILPYLVITALLQLAAGPAHGLPAGRAWTSVQLFGIPGHTRLTPEWLKMDSLGNPSAFAVAYGGIGKDAFGLHWADSTWIQSWQLGQNITFSWFVLSPPGTAHLIWEYGTSFENAQGTWSYLSFASFGEGGLTSLDTVAVVWAGIPDYAGTVRGGRRWASVGDHSGLRVLYSDTLRVWREVPVAEQNGSGVGVAALDDTSLLVAWVGEQGPDAARWGILRGSIWTTGIGSPVADWFAHSPVLRPRPSGGFLSAWGTEKSHISLTTYWDGHWTPPESLRCAYHGAEQHYSYTPDVSVDSSEYPVVAWDAVGVLSGAPSLCVCMSNDSGFTVADELPYDAILPKVARDRNGDVWVAWWNDSGGMFWIHSYTHATCGAPIVGAKGTKRLIQWTLSEPAPGTWWAVLRAEATGPFEQVARVRAGPSVVMQWADIGPHDSPNRYRIRRESIDTRYQWLSAEGAGPVGVEPGSGRGDRLLLARVSPNPSGRPIRYELRNASPGTLDIQVYDLRGRVMLRQRRYASGSGVDTIELDLASASPTVTSGLYFLRVADASGRESPSAKFVWLR